MTPLMRQPSDCGMMNADCGLNFRFQILVCHLSSFRNRQSEIRNCSGAPVAGLTIFSSKPFSSATISKSSSG